MVCIFSLRRFQESLTDANCARLCRRPLYFKQIWTNCWDPDYFRCSVTFVNVRLMSGLATIRQLLIFDNVLFVRIILPFASPLDPWHRPSLIRITNLQRNNANSEWFWLERMLTCVENEMNPCLQQPSGFRRYIFLSDRYFDVGYVDITASIKIDISNNQGAGVLHLSEIYHHPPRDCHIQDPRGG